MNTKIISEQINLIPTPIEKKSKLSRTLTKIIPALTQNFNKILFDASLIQAELSWF